MTLAFRVEATKESPVWCFASRTDSDGTRTVYAGTGPNGVVLQSTDLETWSTFMTVDDCHVRSLAIWANALFVGTQPEGKVYVHNFTSGAEYLFVETEGKAVTALAEYGGKLFAGTAPVGIIYSFDGILWKEEYRPYGRGITSMVASSGLFVSSLGAEGPVVYDGKKWSALPTTAVNGQVETVASNRIATGGIHGATGLEKVDPTTLPSDQDVTGQEIVKARPVSPQFNIVASVVTPGGPIFGGLDDGVIMAAGSDTMSKVCDVGVPVTGLLYVSKTAMMIASGGTMFLATTPEISDTTTTSKGTT